MDKTDEKILELMERNARISYQELGDAIGMTRVAAKKRVRKLEMEGVIRGYNTCIYREQDITLFIDIVTVPGRYEKVLRFLTARAAYVRQIFRTTKENHIHMVAVSDSVENLRNLTRMIREKCGEDIVEIHSHAVKEVIKDVYGGIGYEAESESGSESDVDGDHESAGRRAAEREAWEQL